MKISTIITSIILGVLILFNSLRVSLNYAYYEIDTKGFIEKLCENKDKPELQCNGKCHLKKVTESSSKESKEPNRLIDFKEILLYTEKPFEYNFKKIYYQNKIPSEYLNLYTYIGLENCFHPPQV
ncbi:hypothetical protein SAMN05428642_102652 [Flaviramulus basaltis]|uniref:Uncharacterized protein n=1 Tax=Flaviramulus basaltis TaxID=369401 RepID=A0A1K2IKX0_9FLAO|nr:hypothetical protein [Flaviramulus basaltis]SFZ92315.1 hypothetical protein SAMN05428642_102652 [Flaviramulus basaltis]